MTRDELEELINSRSVILDLRFHMPTMTRKANVDGLSDQLDSEMFILSKRLVKSDNYNAIRNIAMTTRRTILRFWALPSRFRDGIYRIPRNLLDNVIRYIERAIEQFNLYADRFAQEYSQLIEEAKERLGEYFNPDDYPAPENIRRRFWVEYRVARITTEDLENLELTSTISSRIAELEANDIKAAILTTMKEIFTSLSKAVTHQLENKKNRWIDKAWRDFRKFIEVFSERNIINDPELDELAKQAKEITDTGDLNQIQRFLTATNSKLSESITFLRNLTLDD